MIRVEEDEMGRIIIELPEEIIEEFQLMQGDKLDWAVSGEDIIFTLTP